MARPQNSASLKMAKKYCDDFPDATTRGLATKLYKEHPKLYLSWEHCRSRLRMVRGEMGKRSRQECKTTSETTKQIRLAIPKSDYEDVTPYVMSITGKGLLISDVHIPYHDVNALTMAITEAIDRKHTDFVVILGDFIDHYSLSRWEKDPEARRFVEELHATTDMLKELKRHFKTVIYKGGNHERRYESYMRMKAPELIGLKELEFENMMQLKELGVEWVKWSQVIYVGDHLTLLHGDEYPRGAGSPVNPARGMFLRASACTVSAHQHQASTNNKPDIRRKIIANWSLGCLCGLSPEYSPLNGWTHGWALMRFDGDQFEVENRKVINNKAYPA